MVFLQTFILALVSLTAASPLGDEVPSAYFCNPPFFEVAGGCFHLNTTLATWHDARHYCLSLSGENSAKTDLATVSDCNQFSLIWQYLTTEFGAQIYWMGGTDEGQEGNWHWVTGESMPMGHPYWTHGQPNNYPDDNCLAYDTSGYFVCLDCGEEKNFLCQEF